ncbi:MAG TPA: S41 family peptidase [Blastocatellia bacterium]|nr:S41 family peptidase [Blastocatellia bacterium]
MKTFTAPLTLAIVLITGLCSIALQAPQSVLAQSDLNLQRQHGLAMLKVIKGDLKRNYYDPNFRGADIDTRFDAAEAKINEAESVGHIFGAIAQVLFDLNDPHTFFLPPQSANRVAFGLQMQAVGDKVYIVAVKPGSDAEKKGVKVGDQALSVHGFLPSREVLWKLNYMFYTLRPQPGLLLTLQSPEGEPRRLEVTASVKPGKVIVDLGGLDYIGRGRDAEDEDRFNPQRHAEVGDNLLVWKAPTFVTTEAEVEEIMIKARKREALILDLRGNPGGYAEILQWFAGYFFDKEIKIADLRGRKKMKPTLSKPHGARNFKGKLIVLVDSKSASTAEIFARVVQLEKRGIVIGDRTAGAVMQSRIHGHKLGNVPAIFYGVNIPGADVVMADGKSLEGVGMTPDELLLPTAIDLAAKRDPALSRAASLVGVELPSDKAGKMFPVEWYK